MGFCVFIVKLVFFSPSNFLTVINLELFVFRKFSQSANFSDYIDKFETSFFQV